MRVAICSVVFLKLANHQLFTSCHFVHATTLCMCLHCCCCICCWHILPFKPPVMTLCGGRSNNMSTALRAQPHHRLLQSQQNEVRRRMGPAAAAPPAGLLAVPHLVEQHSLMLAAAADSLQQHRLAAAAAQTRCSSSTARVELGPANAPVQSICDTSTAVCMASSETCAHAEPLLSSPNSCNSSSSLVRNTACQVVALEMGGLSTTAGGCGILGNSYCGSSPLAVLVPAADMQQDGGVALQGQVCIPVHFVLITPWLV